MEKFCTHCGAKLTESSKFCTECGKPIMSENVPPTEASQSCADKKVFSAPKLVFGLILSVFALIFIGINTGASANLYGALRPITHFVIQFILPVILGFGLCLLFSFLQTAPSKSGVIGTFLAGILCAVTPIVLSYSQTQARLGSGWWIKAILHFGDSSSPQGNCYYFWFFPLLILLLMAGILFLARGIEIVNIEKELPKNATIIICILAWVISFVIFFFNQRTFPTAHSALSTMQIAGFTSYLLFLIPLTLAVYFTQKTITVLRRRD